MMTSFRAFFNRIRQILAAPAFAGDEEKTRVAGLLNTILLAALAAQLVFSATAPFTDPDPTPTWIINASLAALELGLLFLARRGWARPAALLLTAALWLAVALITLLYSGVSGPGPALFTVVIIIAGLLLGGGVGLVFTGLSLAAVLGTLYAETNGLVAIDPAVITRGSMVSTLIAAFVLGGALLHLATRSLGAALERARRNERAQAQANRELEALRASLESQVAQRTRDLERRTNYMEASAQISQAASSILDTDELIRQVVELIRERFNLYHAAIFMLDPTSAWAEYRAGTGEAGRILAQEGLRLEAGGRSMVGRCIANAKARVAEDTQLEALRLDHPLLPDTRSEAALPLVARGRVTGALNVQSAQPGAFDRDALAVLQTLADQIAIAIDNAQLFQQAQKSLEAERQMYSRASREAWGKLLQTKLAPGYRYAENRVAPIGDTWTPEMQAALRQARSVAQTHAEAERAEAVFAAPIQVRGQTIGVLDIRKQAGQGEWTASELALLQTLTEQLGLALDSAQLYQNAQRLAAREQTINTLTAAIRGTPAVDAILQRTVQELGQTFGASRAFIRLQAAEAAPAEQPETQHEESR